VKPIILLIRSVTAHTALHLAAEHRNECALGVDTGMQFFSSVSLKATDRKGSSRMSKRQIRESHIVRIMNGPLTGFRGEVKEVDKLNSIAKVAVQVYGRVTPIDLPLEEIEPVSKN